MSLLLPASPPSKEPSHSNLASAGHPPPPPIFKMRKLRLKMLGTLPDVTQLTVEEKPELRPCLGLGARVPSTIRGLALKDQAQTGRGCPWSGGLRGSHSLGWLPQRHLQVSVGPCLGADETTAFLPGAQKASCSQSYSLSLGQATRQRAGLGCSPGWQGCPVRLTCRARSPCCGLPLLILSTFHPRTTSPGSCH